MTDSIEELMDYALISKYTLDEDNIKQSQLMYDATRNFSVAEESRNSAKLAVEETYAELDGKIRAGASERGEKLSETQIKMQIALQPDMMQAERHLIDMENHRSKWSGVVESIKQRGYALTNLGNLYQANYFSKESSGRARDNVKNDRAEQARSLRQERPARRGSWE